MRRHGFTLIELVMVIVILGILAVVAIPRFIDLRVDAREASAKGVVGAGNAGAEIWHARYLISSTTAPYSVAYPAAGSSISCFEDNSVPIVPGVTFSYDAVNGRWSYTT